MKPPFVMYTCSTTAHWELGETDVKLYATPESAIEGCQCIHVESRTLVGGVELGCKLVQVVISGYHVTDE